MRRALLPLALLLTAQAPAPAPQVDPLLSALATAGSEEETTALETRIAQMWLNAGTPAVTLLMSRGLRDTASGAKQAALDDFSAAIDLQPDLPEAYVRRAIVRDQLGDEAGAIADLEQALTRQPRQFEALVLLSRIAQSMGNWKGAYAAWQRLMTLAPKTPGGQGRLLDLQRHAVGDQT